MRRRVLHVRLDALRLPAGAAAPAETKAKLTAALAAALAAKARGSAAEGPASTGPELRRAAEIIAARIGLVHGRPR
ncbi:hypothetical protein [Paracoccus chinensis]|uniref:Uncharacterized protein n=1 Tax=Paracoccus chinensis TaxID=525640 RepID=A0A1G9I717_9RHOB|nr:hypothetical protein [Paracoccus chinensis]SDL21028.1 hypothetical protein SAMN04487971_107169 [Paracoccus chinensis]